jgi:hypothetical protein
MDYSIRMKRHGSVTGSVIAKGVFQSGMFIVVTGETQAAAWLLKQRAGWLTGRTSWRGAKAMRLAASSRQERLECFQLSLGLMGGQRGVSLGQQLS